MDMIKALDPHYELPGHKYISKTAIPNLYNKVLLSGANRYSLTTDMPYVILSVEARHKISITCHT